MTAARPMLPAGIGEFFAPMRSPQPEGGTLVYQPALVAITRTHYEDKRNSIDHVRELAVAARIEDGPVSVDWEQSSEIAVSADDLGSEPPEKAAEFAELPQAALNKGNYTDWQQQLVSWIYSACPLELYSSPALKAVSRPEESERDFRIRLEQLAREARDLRMEQLRRKYAPKVAALQERIRRAEGAVEREKEQAQQQKMQSTIAIGATLIGALFGSKLASARNVRGVGSAARSMSRAGREAGDVRRAEENLDALRQQLEELEGDLRTDCAAVESAIDSRTEELERTSLRPKKSSIEVRFCALTWLPYWRMKTGGGEPAWL
jgi:hypothetical protein